jgi:chlorite dismutase
MPGPLLVRFVGGAAGQFRVLTNRAVAGEPLGEPRFVAMLEGQGASGSDALWTLQGISSHQRYVTRTEGDDLRRRQAGLGRPEATRAAMIPIRKSEAWWALAQDERRAIFEEQSRHVAGTLKYLPAIARRLHHSRDLGEPFDFVTWFEYAPEHEALFDELVAMLRETEEWRWVEREVDLRLARV